MSLTAMQFRVGLIRDRAVFPANEGGKFPGALCASAASVIIFRILNRRHVGYPTHVRSSPQQRSDVIFRFRPLSNRLRAVLVSTASPTGRRDPGFCALHERSAGNTVVIDASNDTHQLGMIRYHQKSRVFPAELDGRPGVRHRRAFGKSVRHVRRRRQVVIGEGIWE